MQLIKTYEGRSDILLPSNLTSDEEKDMLTNLYVILYFLLSDTGKFSRISVQRVGESYSIKYRYHDICHIYLCECIVKENTNIEKTLKQITKVNTYRGNKDEVKIEF